MVTRWKTMWQFMKQMMLRPVSISIFLSILFIYITYYGIEKGITSLEIGLATLGIIMNFITGALFCYISFKLTPFLPFTQIPGKEGEVLRYLYTNPKSTHQQIAAEVGLSPGQTANLLMQLTSQGLIKEERQVEMMKGKEIVKCVYSLTTPPILPLIIPYTAQKASDARP